MIARQRGERGPTTKAEAETWRDRLRAEIRSGTFRSPKATPTPDPNARLTFDDLCSRYLTSYVRVPTRRKSAMKMFEIHLAVLQRATIPGPGGSLVRFGDKAIETITKADVEAVRTWRRQEMTTAAAPKDETLSPEARAARKRLRQAGAKAGAVGLNRLLARLRHVFSWAIAEGYCDATPFKRGPVTVIQLESRAETSQTRRLEPGEEDRLLEHAGSHLRALIVAALSTGCRAGELLSLQWSQVRTNERDEPRWLVLPAAKTKTHQTRVLPIGSRLRAELAMCRHAPDGKAHPPSAYVFGNEVGECISSIRVAWERTCELAGVDDLHFHDLRREFACRLLESSADLHDVKDFLGHANITTTSTYLRSAPMRLERAIARMDATSEPVTDESVTEAVTDSHTIRTNAAVQENGPSGGQAVTH